MSTPQTFGVDEAYHVLNLMIGLCELAGGAVTAANGSAVMALDSKLFDSAACLLMASRAVFEDKAMGMRTEDRP